MTESTFWLLFTLFWTAVMSFYSMQEMASISCNKLRLDFYVAQKKRWALLLQALLEKPGLLFSTTLVGVNVALMLSSESSRRLFEAWGYDPNLAPLAEIPFVLIFGELVPMFAARVYADHTCRLGSPILYLSSKILAPFNAIIDAFFHSINRLMGKKDHKASHSFLSRDELQKLLQEEHHTPEEPLHAMIGNVFTLKNKHAFQLMRPLEQFPSASTHMTIGTLRRLAAKAKAQAFCVYVRSRQKVVGMIYPKELLNASDTKKVDDFTKPACFVTQGMHALELLSRLQEEEATVAVVLNEQGEALGVVVLDDVLDELFGQEIKSQESLTYLEKTISGDTKIADFNEAYGTKIDPQNCKTFAELIEKLLGRHPSPQDIVSIEPLEITVKETTLFKAKTIQVKTKSP